MIRVDFPAMEKGIAFPLRRMRKSLRHACAKGQQSRCPYFGCAAVILHLLGMMVLYFSSPPKADPSVEAHALS